MRLSTGGTVPDIYRRKAVPHLQQFIRHILYVRKKYFVIYDDLASTQPAEYTWLYHILPDQRLDFDSSNFAADYTVGNINVRLQHFAKTGKLKFENRRGLEGHINPITGEDYRKYYRDDILCAHNLWISNKEPASQWHFLAVIYPQPPGDKIPAINQLDDNTIKVGEDRICFDPNSSFARHANILVNINVHR